MEETTDYLMEQYETFKQWETYVGTIIYSLLIIFIDSLRYYISGERFIGIAVTRQGFEQIGYILIFVFFVGVVLFWLTPKNAWYTSVLAPIVFFFLNSLIVTLQATYDSNIILKYLKVSANESILLKYWIVTTFSFLFYIFALFIPMVGLFLFGYLVGNFLKSKITKKI